MNKLTNLKILAALLFLLSTTCLVYSVRAAWSSKIYNEIRFRDEVESRQDPEHAHLRAELAHSLYPHNYYFSIWIAENCWYYRNDANGQEVADRVDLAGMWCDRGLGLNPAKSQLRLLKARLMARDDPSAGADYWAEYVDWHFWDRYNHAALVELYAEAGNLEKAMAELEWTKGTAHYEYANKVLQAAWRREMQSIPQ